MAAKIINLKQARKHKARDRARSEATERAAVFGRNAASKKADAAETNQREAHLDRVRLEILPKDVT